jgi:thiamine-monophosphate kinase
MSESALIQQMLAVVGRRPGVWAGIGDDAAVLEGEPPWLIAHDMLVEDVHFRWSTHSVPDVGHKALAVNLSDIAAMGGRPVAAIVGLASPRGAFGPPEIRAMYQALEDLAAHTGCSIIGGDISRASETVIAITVIGKMAADVAPVMRTGARPGDAVCVTGPLGASAAGRELLEHPRPNAGSHDAALITAHRRPSPRLQFGTDLAAGGATAMMDISDGLALDAHRLAIASGVWLGLELDRVPLADGVAQVAQHLGADPVIFASTSGEDYELLVTIDPSRISTVAVPLIQVGAIGAGPSGLHITRDGHPVHLPHLGWDHIG